MTSNLKQAYVLSDTVEYDLQTLLSIHETARGAKAAAAAHLKSADLLRKPKRLEWKPWPGDPSRWFADVGPSQFYELQRLMVRK